MKPTGVNMTNVKQINRSCVLQLLLTKGAMSRTDLANSLQLTTATLTSICNDFIQKGLLIQSGKADDQNIGRKRMPLEINYHYKYVVAINIHYNGSTVAITDLSGDPVAVQSVSMENSSSSDPKTFLARIASICIRLLWENNLPSDSVLGACVCIVGSVNHIDGISLHPFKIFNDKSVYIKDILEKHFLFPVCVENNVCSFLNAEHIFGSSQEVTNLMVVKWGPGVGSATSTGGVVCKGPDYHSAEIGHTFFYQNSDMICKCGRKGCLESGVNLASFIEKITELQKRSAVIQNAIKRYGIPDINNILYFLEIDCPELKKFTHACIHDLAIGVNNAIQVFSPDKVVLFGTLFETKTTLKPFIETILEINPYVTEDLFEESTLADKKEYIGPAATAIKNFLIEPGGE